MRSPSRFFIGALCLLAGTVIGWFTHALLRPTPNSSAAPPFASTPEVGQPGFPVPEAPAPHSPKPKPDPK
jgi:hypothetical protein